MEKYFGQKIFTSRIEFVSFIFHPLEKFEEGGTPMTYVYTNITSLIVSFDVEEIMMVKEANALH